MSDARGFVGHRPGGMSQSNKRHNTGRHRSKGTLDTKNSGRVQSDIRQSGKKRTQQRRDARVQQSKQIRQNKREAAIADKRKIGVVGAPPHLVCIVDLSSPDCVAAVHLRDVLIAAMTNSELADVAGKKYAQSEAITMYSTKLKKRATFYAPRRSLYDILDAAKVADSMLLLLDAKLQPDSFGTLVTEVLGAHGVSTVSHVITGLDGLNEKKRSQLKKNAEQIATAVFPLSKVQVLKEGDQSSLLWNILNRKRLPVRFRDNRPHILSDDLSFQPSDQDPSSGLLTFKGYLRGQRLDPNRLIHLPGHGACQVEVINSYGDPCDKRGGGEDAMATLTMYPDANKQDSLISEAPVDPLDAEQTWPTDEELNDAEQQNHPRKLEAMNIEKAMQPKGRTIKVPKGWSDYQAAWIVDSEGSDEEGVDDDEDEEDDDERMSVSSNDNADIPAPVVSFKEVAEMRMYNEGDEENEDEYEQLAVGLNREKKYDEDLDMDEEKIALEKFRAAKQDQQFPDEVDTPMDRPAAVRFGKYRGLQSFKHSEWNYLEDLPDDYAKIFQFKDFRRTRKRVMADATKAEDDADGDAEMTTSSPRVSVGTYVTVTVRNIPAEYYESMKDCGPFVVFGLLEHENKMSVLHFKIKQHPDYHTPIKSKERLVFCTGVRTFSACPLFSQYDVGDKHKFERFLPRGGPAVASVFAPIHFPPGPVLVFKDIPGRGLVLVATGNQFSVDPNRMIVKRIRLSGHPFKINKRVATVRYMFWNPDDIAWFQPVELTTKYGRRGHIKESLGTHGHMKCIFDKPLRPEDTIMMNLYKRVYPKWTYAPLGPQYGTPVTTGSDEAKMET